MVIVFAGYKQIGQAFVIYPFNNNNPELEIPLDLTDYENVYMCIKQPDGLISRHLATVVGTEETILVPGDRLDAGELPIDGTHINDENDGTISPAITENINPAPVNDFNNNHIEIPPRYKLTLVNVNNNSNSNTGTVNFNPLDGFTGTVDVTFANTNGGGYIAFPNHSPTSGDNSFSGYITYGVVTIENNSFTQSVNVSRTGLAFIFGGAYNSAKLHRPIYQRPFTSVSLKKLHTLILKRNITQSNTGDLLLYVRGSAFPVLNIHFFKNNIFQGTSIVSGIENVLSIPIIYEFDEINIEVTENTNGAGIELGGISIEENNVITQVNDWTEALITSPSTFPFDEDLDTETDLADGSWIFNYPENKQLVSIALTRPVGTVDNPVVNIELININGTVIRLFMQTPELTNGTPSLVNIDNIPREYNRIRIYSTASFSLHELNVQTNTFGNLTNASISYIDSEGILNQKGHLEYWAKVNYKDGTSKNTYTRGNVFVK